MSASSISALNGLPKFSAAAAMCSLPAVGQLVTELTEVAAASLEAVGFLRVDAISPVLYATDRGWCRQSTLIMHDRESDTDYELRAFHLCQELSPLSMTHMPGHSLFGLELRHMQHAAEPAGSPVGRAANLWVFGSSANPAFTGNTEDAAALIADIAERGFGPDGEWQAYLARQLQHQFCAQLGA
jgi:hypothetical protein